MHQDLSLDLAEEKQPIDSPARPVGTRLRARRNPKLLALGILLTCLGGLLAAWLYSSLTNSQEVIQVRKPISQGQEISEDALSIISVGSLPGVPVVPAEKLNQIIGKKAFTDLTPGMLLTSSSYGKETKPKGYEQLGLKIPIGRLPNFGITVSTAIKIIELSENGNSPGKQFDAVVVSKPQNLASKQIFILDVAVPKQYSARIAVLAAKDRLVIIKR